MNKLVRQRLEGILAHLKAAHQMSVAMSSNVKGVEREVFIKEFLRKVFPPIYRFGAGDITDLSERTSGQVDIVVEYPFGPSLPNFASDPEYLYLAETVACAIEVKSDLQRQWDDVQRKANAVAALRRVYGGIIAFNAPAATLQIGGNPDRIPYVAVGYQGWKTYEAARAAFDSSTGISALLSIEPLYFISREQYWANGPNALWLLICHMQGEIQRIAQAAMNPQLYGLTPENAQAMLDGMR